MGRLKPKVLAKNQENPEPTKIYSGFDVYHMDATHDAILNPASGKPEVATFLGLLPAKKGTWWHYVDADGWPVIIVGLNAVLECRDLDPWIARVKESGPQFRGLVVVHMQVAPDVFDYAQSQLPGFEWSFLCLTPEKLGEMKGAPTVQTHIEADVLVFDEFWPCWQNAPVEAKKALDPLRNWRCFVDWIMIDWNWDGKVMKPKTYDIPGKDEQVSGRYMIPEGAGEIRIKVVDIRGTPWECSVSVDPVEMIPARQKAPPMGQQSLFG